MKEKSLSSLNGLGTLAGALLVALAGAALFVMGVAAKASTGSPNLLLMLLGALLVALGVFILAGLYTIQPNQAAVLSLFGKYVGTVKDNGLRWNNPFFAKRRVSQRVRNFESGKL
ncbi:MAG: SPFH domain-containing protein, partial [Dyella sp.]|nr:SPFH domain-containing protein [Dyella sp.]